MVEGKALADVLNELKGVITKAGSSITSSINKGIGVPPSGGDGATAATGGVGGGIGGGDGANFEEKLSSAISGGDHKALSLLGLSPSPDFWTGLQTGLNGGTGEVVNDLFSGLSDFGQLFGGNTGTHNFLAANAAGIHHSYSPALMTADAAGSIGATGGSGANGGGGCGLKRNCLPIESFLGKFVNVLNNVKKQLPVKGTKRTGIADQGTLVLDSIQLKTVCHY